MITKDSFITVNGAIICDTIYNTSLNINYHLTSLSVTTFQRVYSKKKKRCPPTATYSKPCQWQRSCQCIPQYGTPYKFIFRGIVIRATFYYRSAISVQRISLFRCLTRGSLRRSLRRIHTRWHMLRFNP